MQSSILSIVKNGFFIILLLLKCLQVSGEPKDHEYQSSCERKRERCVCNMQAAVRELRSFVVWTQESKLEQELNGFKCEKFLRLPAQLEVDGTMEGLVFSSSNPNPEPAQTRDGPSYFHYYEKRRRKARSNRERLPTLPQHVFFGTPTNAAFEAAMAKVDPNALHQYVIFGSTAKFQCARQPLHAGRSIEKFVWSHYNGNPLHSKAVVHDDTGELEIPMVGLSDVDIYNCSVFRTGESEPHRTVSHQLSVVTEPLFVLQLVVKYETTRCNQQEAKALENSVPIWTEKYIAKAVIVHHSLATCGSKYATARHTHFHESDSGDSEGGELAYRLEMSVSTLGMQFAWHGVSHRTHDACGTIGCIEKLQTKINEQLRDTLLVMFGLPIEVKDSKGQKVMHSAVGNSQEMQLVLACIPGFALRYKLCFPCDPGFHSEKSSMNAENCIPCPVGTYQPLPASGECLPCPDDHLTRDVGSTSRTDCYNTVENALEGVLSAAHIGSFMENSALMIGGGLGGGIVLILIAVLLSVCFCCPNNAFGRFLRRIFCLTKKSDQSQDLKEERKVRTTRRA